MKKIKYIIVGIMLICSMISLTNNVMAEDGNWTMTIYEENQTVTNTSGTDYVEFQINATKEAGNVNVSGWELTYLNWDPDILELNSVTEGSWLSNIDSTFYAEGDIDNDNGNVTDTICAILGATTCNASGVMCTLNFTVVGEGITQINFSSIISLVETEYDVTEGTGNVTVQGDSAPEITDNSPASGTTGDSFLFNVSVTDDVDTASSLTVKVNWTHGGNGANNTMNYAGGTYFTYDATLDDSISNVVYHIYANDTKPNSNYTGELTATVQDNDDPTFVSDGSDGSGTTADSFSFSIDASDNIQAESELTCYVNWSHDTTSSNDSMSYVGGHWTKDITLDDSVSDLTYTFWINDTAGNMISDSGNSPAETTDNDAPTLVDDGSDASGTTGDSFDFVLDASDNIDAEADLTAYVNWTHGSNSGNDSMVYSTGSWRKTVTLDSNSVADLTYHFYINDSTPNALWTSGDSPVSITDNDKPTSGSVVFNETFYLVDGEADKVFTIDWMNITSTITDNIGATSVYINITTPSSTYDNTSIISNNTGNVYWKNNTYGTRGTYTVFFYTEDDGSNINMSSSDTFTVYEKWDVTQNNDVGLTDITSVTTHYGETGANRWIKQDVVANGDIGLTDITSITTHYGESY